MIRLRVVGGLLGLLLVGHCWAESAPEVTFKVDPSRARIYYEATTVSSGDQQLMLGDGMPGHPLRLKDEFFKGGRDRYTLIFRDPGGDFKELSKSFGKFELKDGSTYPVVLEPATWKGHLIRYPWVPVLFLGLGGAGAFGWWRSRRLQREAEASKGGDSLMGLKLDGYKVVQLLGRGAVGRVYRAESDTERPDVIAVKFMEPDATGLRGVNEDRMLNEAQIHLRLSHPNILKCYKAGKHKNYVYLHLAFVADGKTLKSWLKPEGWKAPEIVRAMKPIFEALQYAHDLGVVHRDLKPENIMLDPSGVPIVADFGMAKDHTADMTQSNMTFGTSLYMPPEQFGGSRHAVAQSDQYALGVMLFEFLTGEPPFVGETFGMMYVAHTTKPAPHLPEREDLSGELDAVLQRMLRKAPAERFPDLKTCYSELAKAAGL